MTTPGGNGAANDAVVSVLDAWTVLRKARTAVDYWVRELESARAGRERLDAKKARALEHVASVELSVTDADERITSLVAEYEAATAHLTELLKLPEYRAVAGSETPEPLD